jgi:hypothetical protein
MLGSQVYKSQNIVSKIVSPEEYPGPCLLI